MYCFYALCLCNSHSCCCHKKVYLNQIINWLNRYNKKNLKIIKNKFIRKQDFYLNNKKLMSKIKIKNELYELKSECLNLSKKMFN